MSVDRGNPFPAEIQSLGIITPAGIPDVGKLQKGITTLQSWGLNVVLSGPIQSVRFLAGTDRDRAQQINQFLSEKTVDMILAARGGYGCTRILDFIDWDLFLRRGISIVGYSDLTALHLKAFSVGSRACIAGPMAAGAFARLQDPPPEGSQFRASVSSFARLLRLRHGSERSVSHPCKALKRGTVRAPIVPANLAVLAALLGTPHLPDLTDAILVLEDINEAAFRIDRYLNQLLQSGILKRLGGLVFGQFTDCQDDEFLPEVFAEFAGHVPGPVACRLPFGHENESISLPVGSAARLTVEQDAAMLVF